MYEFIEIASLALGGGILARVVQTVRAQRKEKFKRKKYAMVYDSRLRRATKKPRSV